jgi:hypothetical protein
VNKHLKILLLLDNAPGNSPHIYDIDDNMTIMFLLLDTPSLIQPMNQGSITTFKRCLWKTFLQLVKDTAGGEGKLSVKDL